MPAAPELMPGFGERYAELNLRHMTEKLALLDEEEAAVRAEMQATEDPERQKQLREMLMRCEANGRTLDAAIGSAQTPG